MMARVLGWLVVAIMLGLALLMVGVISLLLWVVPDMPTMPH
jgi:hypothetical protein